MHIIQQTLNRSLERLILERTVKCGFIVTLPARSAGSPAAGIGRKGMRFHHQGYCPVQCNFNYLGFDILSFQLHPLHNELLLQQQLSVTNKCKSNPIARIIKFYQFTFLNIRSA